MPIVTARTLLIFVFLVIAGVGARVHAAGVQDEPRYEIRVNNIRVQSLVVVLAELGKFGVVTGDELKNRRVNVAERSIALPQLLTRIASDQNLAIRADRGVRLIASPCRLSAFPELPDQAAFRKSVALKVTMNFQSVTAAVMTELFADVTGVRVDVAGVNTKVPTAMLLRDKPAGDFIAIVATVKGWSMVLAENGTLRFVPNQRARECGAPAAGTGRAVGEAVTNRFPVPARTCRSTTKSKCMPLEYFTLEELSPLGYIRSLPDSRRFALIEVSEGVVYPAEVGDYMGANYGRIDEITDRGIVLYELVQNPDGTRKEQRKTIAFQ